MSQLQQWINRAIWMDGADLGTEFRQAAEEGRDLTSIRVEVERLLAAPKPSEEWHVTLGGARDEAWLKACAEVVERIQTLPYRPDFAYDEPSELEAIRAARPAPPTHSKWIGDDETWKERLAGGLMGRICGCLLGKPVEGWRRSQIRAVAESQDNWPLRDYLRPITAAESDAFARSGLEVRFGDHVAGCLKGQINGFPEDDDINYTTLGFAVVEAKGTEFTSLDIAEKWCQDLPIFHTCTAERVAYRNFVSNVLPPQSATHRNPFREWIGAQIRADFFGYANPGNPERAAEWAWRDASISHVKNGIYGEMWVAAMLATAYVESDWIAIIRAGLAQIPKCCRLRDDVEKVIAMRASNYSFMQAVDAIHAQWDEKVNHDWCHTNSNAQVVALGLLYGDDDYTKTIACSVMPGFDTDCNGATCGSLWGVRHGLSAIPTSWTEPLNDRVRTGVANYEDVSISGLADSMFRTAKRNA